MMTMRLLICSLEDPASVNIRDALLSREEWSGEGEFDGHPTMRWGDMLMITIPGTHLFADNIDRRVSEALSIKVDEVLFLSRHKAASGQRSLTVHPIGNWRKADYGGREGELVTAAPELMTGLLRSLKAAAQGLDFDVVFEVTHHGPWLESPTLFIEIGSSEATWGDRDAGNAVARALLDAKVESYPKAIGIGGGHYAPRFTEVGLAKKVSFGHMLPGHAMDMNDQASLSAMISKAMESTGTDLAYVHKKSMKRSETSMVAGLVTDLGGRVIDSSDLQDL